MTTYHVVATTKNKDDKSKIEAALKLAQIKTEEDFKVAVYDHPDDPADEAGEYILWYFSASHKQVRYFVGPPEGQNPKPIWSYKKKEAAKLSKKACETTMQRLALSGYTTPLKMDKGGPDLTVVAGDFGKDPYEHEPTSATEEDLEAAFLAQGGVKFTFPEAESPESVIAQAGHSDPFKAKGDPVTANQPEEPEDE